MKRFWQIFTLMGVLTMPVSAFAGEQAGVYLAPKFIYGFTILDGMKTSWGEGADPGVNSNIGNGDDSAFGGALAIGYDFNRKFQVPVRAELEYTAFSEVEEGVNRSFTTPISGHWSAKQKLQIQTLFVNAYYDFRNSTAFTPYLGAGAGMSFITTKARFRGDDYDNNESTSGSTGSKTATNFAWNIGAGIAYDFNDYLSLDLGYRFAGLGDAKTNWVKSSDGDNWVRSKTSNVYMHQVITGLRINF
ncbi:MAG: outer membrane beta-barrel protein [Desulfovibrio sp.]|jgi:opacity protein-like surface antigen|nr:outer membrane beta-barrel protein [Desulfovibrio sp.]